LTTTPENISLLEVEGRGPLSSNIGEAGGFFHTREGLPASDIQLHAAPAMFYDEGLGSLFDHGYSIGPCLLKPTSRGKVSLRSTRPDAKPRILHNYFATSEDRASMIEGVRIAEQHALQVVQRSPHLVPASDSEADIWDFVKQRCHTLYHPTSTCAMGRVVDNQLRVFGCEALRVIDASVMPTVVRGNTNAPTIMIAEKAADLVRASRHD
jgi:choline dehydrogenase-like flavoprotein